MSPTVIGRTVYPSCTELTDGHWMMSFQFNRFFARPPC
jgi:hypothetical protein